MYGRILFTESEKSCLNALVLKYKLDAKANPDARSLARKKYAWARLTETFNAIKTNHQRNEAQLKKCWDNMKTRRKQILRERMKQELRMKTGGGSYNNALPSPSLRDDSSVLDAETQFSTDNDILSADYVEVQLKTERVYDSLPSIEAAHEEINTYESGRGDTQVTHPFHEVSRDTVQPEPEYNPSAERVDIRSTRSRTGSRFSDNETGHCETGMGSEAITEELDVLKDDHKRIQRREEELHELKILEQKWLVKAAEERFKKARYETLIAKTFLEQAKKNKKNHFYDI